MIIPPRALWISLVGAIAIASALSGCATKDDPPAPAAVAQCYWLSNEGAGWVARPDLADPELCFEMDSCSGGVGLSGGGCYKWALGRDAPGIPWTELGLTPLSRVDPAAEEAAGAACYRKIEDGWAPSVGREAQCFERDYCSGGLGQGEDDVRPCFKWAMGPNEPALPWSATLAHPRLAADIPPPHDIYEDQFEMTSDSCFENCDYPARIAAATRIYARPDPSSPLVATLSADECVMVRDFRSLSATRRGVVLETRGQFNAGDVIYYLAYGGEGTFSVWRRGETLEGSEYDGVIQWDPSPATADPRVGSWHELVRANGASGWAKDLESSRDDCTFR